MKRRIAYYILVFLISLIVLGSLSLSSGLNHKNELKLHDMIYGTASKPFVYRQLMPFSIRIGVGLIPAGIRNFMLEKASQSSTVGRILTRAKLPGELFVEYAVTVIFIYFSLWGFVFSFRFLLRALYDSPTYFIDIVSAAALIGIPAFFSYSFIYDIPTLFLFTLASGLMVSRRWGLYVMVFFLGCWSKETTILLTLMFFLFFYRNEYLSRPFFRKIFFAQIGIFVVVKCILTYVYYDNPGSVVEFHFIHNMLFGYQYSLSMFVTWIILSLLLFYKWREKPVFLKNALWIGIPLVLLTLFLGLLHEMRDYGELYPILVALIAHSIASVLDIPCSQKETI